MGFPQECHQAGLILFVIAADRKPLGRSIWDSDLFLLTEVTVFWGGLFVSIHAALTWPSPQWEAFQKPWKGGTSSYAPKSHIIKDDHYVGFQCTAWRDWQDICSLVGNYIAVKSMLLFSTSRFNRLNLFREKICWRLLCCKNHLSFIPTSVFIHLNNVPWRIYPL